MREAVDQVFVETVVRNYFEKNGFRVEACGWQVCRPPKKSQPLFPMESVYRDSSQSILLNVEDNMFWTCWFLYLDCFDFMFLYCPCPVSCTYWISLGSYKLSPLDTCSDPFDIAIAGFLSTSIKSRNHVCYCITPSWRVPCSGWC